MQSWSEHSATNKNLLEFGLKPIFIWLIKTALDQDVITYQRIKKKLEIEVDFSTIFTTRIGFVVGELMNRILEKRPDAPLINVLVVNGTDNQPSRGAGPFMAARFLVPELEDRDFKSRNPEIWSSYVERSKKQVYEYTKDQWHILYNDVFGENITTTVINDYAHQNGSGAENDYGSGTYKYGPGGESEHHKSLRIWAMNNPHEVHNSFYGAISKTEFNLYSGDRIDVLYDINDRIIIVEVKSHISNKIDLRRGVFQCIKYRAVISAMGIWENPKIETILLTESAIPEDIHALAEQHGVKHVQAQRERR